MRSDHFSGGGVPSIVFGPRFFMAMCKWVRMCKLECWGMLFKNPVYSVCGVVLMLRGVGWSASM